MGDPRARRAELGGLAINANRLTAAVHFTSLAGIVELVQRLPGHPRRQSALAVPIRASGPADPPGGQLHRPACWREGEAWKGPALHVAPFLRLLSCGPGRRSQDYAGLSRPP